MGAAEDLLANFRAIAAEEAQKAVTEAMKRLSPPKRIDSVDKDYLTTKEAAKLLKRTTRTIMNLIDAGMPCHRVGHAYRFKRSELEEWMKNRKRSG